MWLDVVDPSADEIEAFGQTLGLHALTVEDALHRGQRPKTEPFDGYSFVVLRPFIASPGSTAWDVGEVHALVGRRFVGTVRFGPDPFGVEPARHRWEAQPDLLHAEGGAFVLWALADEVIDGYLEAVEAMEDVADLLEDEVFEDGGATERPDLQQRIFRHKRDATRLRRFALPLRPALDLIQEEPDLVSRTLVPYYRDLTEHVLRVADLTDNIRDLLTALLEVRVAQVANRLNEIMRKLSAWAGIILVPTLIAGIYGMNFRHMPELGWLFGYPLALGLMLGAAGTLYAVFRRKGWL